MEDGKKRCPATKHTPVIINVRKLNCVVSILVRERLLIIFSYSNFIFTVNILHTGLPLYLEIDNLGIKNLELKKS